VFLFHSFVDRNEENKMDCDDRRDYMDQNISAGHFPTAKFEPIAQFLTDMADWMNLTSEDLNVALEKSKCL
jgi:hypothetical protein